MDLLQEKLEKIAVSQVVSKAQQQDQPILTIIHFNDVYDIQQKGGSMGVCNFKAQLDQLKLKNPKALLLFSGDAFSPSTLTNIKEGWQMVYALNKLGIDCACYGNHEFDFQHDHTLKLAKACNFPWTLGNLIFTPTNQLLGNGEKFVIKERDGIKIGIFGVAGPDWPGILSEQYQELVEYEDVYDYSNLMAKFLRQQQKCQIVVALTHMRNANDSNFPNHVTGVDIVLGGHDHVIMEQFTHGIPVIKSGTNFNNIGIIKFYSKNRKTEHEGVRFNFQWKIQKIYAHEKVDQDLRLYVDNLMNEYSQYDEVVGYTDVPLQARFTKIRSQQSNMGNFFVDLVKNYYDCDAALINAGMIRNDMLIPIGKLSYSKISNIINSPMVVKILKGRYILDALQYSVAEYPGYAGKFLFISGFKFEFDHTKTPRVQNVWFGQQKLQLQSQYTVAMTLYQSKGGDGFDMLRQGKVIVDQVQGTNMLNLLLKFFKASDTLQQYESMKMLKQIPLPEQSFQTNPQFLPNFPEEHLILVKKVSVRMGRIKDLRSRFALWQGKKLTCIAPSIDGRIICLSKQKQ